MPTFKPLSPRSKPIPNPDVFVLDYSMYIFYHTFRMLCISIKWSLLEFCRNENTLHRDPHLDWP
jgi:hypothetical protein